MANTYSIIFNTVPPAGNGKSTFPAPFLVIKDDSTQVQPFNLSVVGAYWSLTLATEAQVAFTTVYP